MKLLRNFQVLTVLAIMPVFVENSSANILLNPGFESGVGGDADDWQESAGPTGSGTRSGLMPNTGSFSAYMEVDHVNNSPAAVPYAFEQIQPAGSIDNALNYNLSFSAKVDSLNFDGFDMFYQILWLDQDGSDGGGVRGESLTQLIPAGINTSYQSFGLSDMNVPDGTDSFLLRFQISPGPIPNIANGLYVDDVDLSAVTSGGLLGDFDMDGDVDGADFLKWQRGETTPPLNATDIANWQLNYGMQSPSIAPNLAAIPEPSALCLLSLGFFGLLSRNLNRASSEESMRSVGPAGFIASL